ADGVNRGVHFRFGIVHRDAAGLFLFLLLRIIRREVGRDAVPALAMIPGAEKELRPDIDGPFLVRRGDEGRIPVKAQLLLVISLWLNIARFEGMPIHSTDITALILSVDVVRVSRIGEGIETVTVEEIFPA